MLNAPLSVLPGPGTSVYVKVSPVLGSVVVNVPTVAFGPAFSAMLVGAKARPVGAALAAPERAVSTTSLPSPPI
jgi:hypothetical protein